MWWECLNIVSTTYKAINEKIYVCREPITLNAKADRTTDCKTFEYLNHLSNIQATPQNWRFQHVQKTTTLAITEKTLTSFVANEDYFFENK